MVKVVGMFLLFVLISSVSAQSDTNNTLGSAFKGLMGTADNTFKGLTGTADITLVNPHTEVGWPNLSGYYNLDCTFTLVNKGDANGFATVDLETDKGILLKKLVDLKVPKDASSAQNTKIAMPLLSLPSSDTIRYKLENQRTATVQEWKEAAEGAVNFILPKLHLF